MHLSNETASRLLLANIRETTRDSGVTSHGDALSWKSIAVSALLIAVSVSMLAVGVLAR